MEGTPAVVYFCRPLSLSLSLSPLAIFDQYYKNQPTDFLRKILPPCPPEYFIAVHPSSDPSFLLPPRVSTGKGRTKSGGRKSVEGAARDSVLLRRVLLLASLPWNFELSNSSWLGEQHRCGRYEIFLPFLPYIFFLRIKISKFKSYFPELKIIVA